MLDFIERYFGVSPDNGNGSIEALLILLLSILIAAAAVNTYRRVRQ
jgi:hypothetical protein